MERGLGRRSRAMQQPGAFVASLNDDHVAPSVMVWTSDYFDIGVSHYEGLGMNGVGQYIPVLLQVFGSCLEAALNKMKSNTGCPSLVLHRCLARTRCASWQAARAQLSWCGGRTQHQSSQTRQLLCHQPHPPKQFEWRQPAARRRSDERGLKRVSGSSKESPRSSCCFVTSFVDDNKRRQPVQGVSGYVRGTYKGVPFRV